MSLQLVRGHGNTPLAKMRQEYALELCDAIAWTLAIANILEIDLDEVVAMRYTTCKGCQEMPCECGYFDVAAAERIREVEQQHEAFIHALATPIGMTDVSVRLYHCLTYQRECHYLGDVVGYTERELMRTRNFGRTCLSQLKEILKCAGLGLGMTLAPEVVVLYRNRGKQIAQRNKFAR